MATSLFFFLLFLSFTSSLGLSSFNSNPLSSLFSIIRQPFHVFKGPETIASIQPKTIPGVALSLLLQHGQDATSDVDLLRETFSSNLRGEAIQALSVSNRLTNTIAEVAQKAAQVETFVTNTMMNAIK